MRLELPFVPASKKNRPIVMVRGCECGRARPVFLPNPKSARDEKRIRKQAALETRGELPRYGDNDVRVSVTWFVHEDCVRVEVEDMGPPPSKGRTGRRRDAQNIPAVILDALEGIAYANDKQVAELVVRKVYGEAVS